MRLGFLEDGSRFSEYKTPGLVGSPESWRCLYPGQLRCADALRITVGFQRGVLSPGSVDPNAGCRILVQLSD